MVMKVSVALFDVCKIIIMFLPSHLHLQNIKYVNACYYMSNFTELCGVK